jgi:2',3'-cyclic-nucleotide 2'-phosphodiesterase/3'-nucleotidase
MRIPRLALALLFFAGYSRAAQVTITLLATTDLHGNLDPYDYLTGQAADRGLAKIATLIAAARAENPNTVLIDCGDTIQGTPLESVYQQAIRKHAEEARAHADPMMLAMNALAYDAMAVGNHEFNFGLSNLALARGAAKFPWISANTRIESSGAARPFAPYFIKQVAGVKVAVIGITTPVIPLWEAPENYRGYHFVTGLEAARDALRELHERHHPDLVIVAAHSGLDGGEPEENVAHQIAAGVTGIDAVVFGHTHQQLAGERVNGVLLMQPKNWGISLGRMDFTLESDPSGKWRVASKSSRLIPVTHATAADPTILAIAKPYHEAAERYLMTPVAEAPAELDGRLSRVEDTALIDAVHQVQLHYAKADVSFASSFNPALVIRKGPVTVRQIAALYIYDNLLYAIEGTGKMVREALENSARYFVGCPLDCTHGPLIAPGFLGFNFDMAQGVDYEIDLTQPEGRRIRNLKWRGQPLADDQPLRLAVNNYRAGGSAGYTMFRGAKIIWRSTDEIRDLVIRYYSERKLLPAAPDRNWRIVPEAARVTLSRSAEAH